MTSINADFVLSFIEATDDIFKKMISRELKRKEVYVKKNYVMFGDISGIVGLSGRLCGTTAVSLPGDMAIDCIGEMIGEDTSGGLSEKVVQDGVGEIINMISGQARTTLASTPYKIQCTLPTIISGRGHELYHRDSTSNVSVIFETDRGEEFALDICLEEDEA